MSWETWPVPRNVLTRGGAEHTLFPFSGVPIKTAPDWDPLLGLEPPVEIHLCQPSTSLLLFSSSSLPLSSRMAEKHRADPCCCRTPFQFLTPQRNNNTASCRRQRVDVTRPQLFPGRQQAEPRLTSILSCTCGSNPVRQTHFVRDPLPIMALLRNALGLPFQNHQRLHMNFTLLTFPIPDSSEATKRKRKQTQTSKQQRITL